MHEADNTFTGFRAPVALLNITPQFSYLFNYKEYILFYSRGKVFGKLNLFLSLCKFTHVYHLLEPNKYFYKLKYMRFK